MKHFPMGRLMVTALSITALSATAETRTVRDFGAVGDGKADDTAAIQKAVDAGIGGIVLPKGIYRLTKTVVVDLDKAGFTSIIGDGTATVVMAGPGPAFRFVGTHEGSADPKSVKPNVWERQRAPMVDAVEIVGDHPEACGVEAFQTMQIVLSRLVIRHCLHGIHLVTRNRNVIVSNCQIYENRGIGLFLDDVNLHQINVGDSHISYNAQGGIVVRAGYVRNLQIGNCDIESNMSPDTPATANVFIDNTTGSNAEIAITGCTIQHNHPSPDSANIRIFGDATMPVAGKDVPINDGNITITGNVLSDVQVNIHLKGVRGVTLTGNTFWMGFAHNLLVEDCANVVFNGNVYDYNPRYAYSDSLTARGGALFRDSRDCTLSAEHVQGLGPDAEAAVTLENCSRFNITGCTILDTAPIGLLLKNVSTSRVSDCLIRNDLAGAKAISVKRVGGKGLLFADNLFDGTEDVGE